MSLLWPILKQALRHPRRTAVIDDRRSYSYAQLAIGAFYLADQIERASDARHVGLMLPTSGGFSMALLATWILGRVPVPLNYLLSPDELGYVIRDSDIDTVLTVGPLLEHIGGAAVIPEGVNIVHLDRIAFTDFPTPRWPASFMPDEPGVILYTSGTSGRPKGVVLSHGNLQFDVEAAMVHAGVSEADAFLGVLPQFHTFGLTALTLLPLRMGAKAIYTARFVPRRIIELARQHKPDVFMAIPSMYGALLSVKNASPEDLSSIRLPVSGGEPLPNAIYDACRERFGLEILEGYGLTETAPITHWSTPTRQKRHAVGTALPGVHTLVVDEHDQPVPPGVDGEILIVGPNVMLGYYKQPELTEQVMSAVHLPGVEGPCRAFRTGDIGHVDEEGFLFITGRKKEMLIIGGENVFPREIEEVLNTHPAVAASAVVGKTDGVRGEVPIAFVELAEGASFDEAELRHFCRERIAQFKVPREVRVIEQLPRSPSGKILRRELQGKA